jgi:imidazolonepropionase-like amidohydrolase
MAESGVFLVPTLSTMIGIARKGDVFGLDPTWIDIAEGILDVHRRSFRAALDAGVVFATGTDGYGDMVDEIAEFLTYGLSPYQAIKAATSDAARVIGPSADYGTLEPGKSADVIACDGDPLEAIERLREIRLVMLRGDITRLDDHALG